MLKKILQSLMIAALAATSAIAPAAQQSINRGTVQADGTGEPLFTAMGKINANFTEWYRVYGMGVITPTDSTKTDNWNPSGLLTANRVDWAGTTSTGFTGMVAPNDGTVIDNRQVKTCNTTNFLWWAENENASSTAANRFHTPNGFPVFLMPNDCATWVYRATPARWYIDQWASQGPAMGLTYFEDFMGVPGSIQSSANGTASAVSSTIVGIDTTFRYMGSALMDTGTTATGRASYGSVGNASIVPTLGAALSVTRLKAAVAPNGTDTYALMAGFCDGSNGTWNDGAAWELRWNGSASEWAQTRMAAATPTRSTTGSPSYSTGAIWLIVFTTPNWGEYHYIYSTDSTNFLLASVQTTGGPSNAQYTGQGTYLIKSLGSTSVKSEVDFIGYRIDQTR